MLAVLLLNLGEDEDDRGGWPTNPNHPLYKKRVFRDIPLVSLERILQKKQRPIQKKKVVKKEYPFVQVQSVKEKIERIKEVSEQIDTPKMQEKLEEVLTKHKKYDKIIDRVTSLNSDNTYGLTKLLPAIDYDSILSNNNTITELDSLIDWVDEEEVILLMVA